MKTIATVALAATMLWTAPGSAETLLVIGTFPHSQAAAATPASLDQKIETALDHACEKPFFRDLKGWQLYRDCRSEVRDEIEDQLPTAGTAGAITVALR